MSLRARSSLAAAVLAAGSIVFGASTPAHAVPIWNPAGTIHPGVQTITSGGQCTANFVFYDSADNIYIGQSAHCASLGGPTDTNGCQTASRPIGTSVQVRGATRNGTLAYSSWIAMQAALADPNVVDPTSTECAYNDFALVKLHADDYGRVNPEVPFWGGPDAVNAGGQAITNSVYTYGNSSLRFGLTQLSPKQGITSSSTGANSWSIDIYTVSPGIPGDSGSAVLDRNGDAFGTLSTLGIDGSNGACNVRLALNYARARSTHTTMTLATVPNSFSSSLI